MSELAKIVCAIIVTALVAGAIAMNAWKADIAGFNSVAGLIAQKEMRVIERRKKAIEVKAMPSVEDVDEYESLMQQQAIAEVVYKDFLGEDYED